MPIYIVNDSGDPINGPSFKKIEKMHLSRGFEPGSSGGSGKKICKVYICTNTDPLQFKLVYNGCRECDCLCDWCLLEGSVNDYYCTYHAEERKQESGQGNCNCDISAGACMYEDCLDEEGNSNPNWVFTPGCYYSYTVDCTINEIGGGPGGGGPGGGGPSVAICYKPCCNSQLSSCSVFGTILDGDNCCAYKNSDQFESGKIVLNPNLYCNCYDEIPPDNPNGWSCP